MLCTRGLVGAGLAGGEDLDLVGVTGRLADGALRGARGNSGVILSQILRGISDVTAEEHLSEIGGPSFAAALRCAEGLVVASMGEAVPGTIVSVLGAAADTAEQSAAGGADVGPVVDARSDERRVGKECVRPGRYRWDPTH